MVESTGLAQVLHEAQDIAQGMEQRVTSAHVLLALFIRENGAQSFLQQKGVDEDRLLELMTAAPLEPEGLLRELREKAREIARSVGSGEVNCLHLLSAFLRVRCAAYELLERTGLDLGLLRNQAFSFLSSGRTPRAYTPGRTATATLPRPSRPVGAPPSPLPPSASVAVSLPRPSFAPPAPPPVPQRPAISPRDLIDEVHEDALNAATSTLKGPTHSPASLVGSDVPSERESTQAERSSSRIVEPTGMDGAEPVVPPAPSSMTAAQLLKRMQVAQHLYALGCFEQRITLYSQQVRALNLIYALLEERVVPPGGCIAVIGAGAAGMTAAAAAAFKGCRVVLLERHSSFLPLQDGNMTRWLHPHIYEWPHPGSDNAVAGLPLLDWKADSAGAVVNQLMDAWYALPPDVHSRIEWHLQTSEVRLEPPDSGPRVIWNCPQGALTRHFDAIILAVGFGVEDRRQSALACSYWKNDDLNQPDLDAANKGSQRRYLVSGCGDGGLVDLLRIRLSKFRHEQVVQTFLGELSASDRKRLETELLEIEAKALGEPDNPYFLHDRYQELQVPQVIDHKLKERLRSDTEAVLMGLGPSPLTLRSSILNRFLVSRLLFKFGVKYLRGKFENAQPIPLEGRRQAYRVQFTDNGQLLNKEFDAVVLRHGPLSALKRDFMPVWKRVHAKFEGAQEVDLTRYPIWPRGKFFGLEGSLLA